MTLPDLPSGPAMMHTKPKKIEIGAELRESIWEAMESSRLTCGLFEGAKLLKCNPDSVMFCVLPEVSGHHDVTVDIQHTLIEAFCWENEIRMVKVAKESSLAKVLEGRSEANSTKDDGKLAMSKVNNNTIMDASCILLEYPKDGPSKCDAAVMEFHAVVLLGDMYPKPVVEFPE